MRINSVFCILSTVSLLVPHPVYSETVRGFMTVVQRYVIRLAD